MQVNRQTLFLTLPVIRGDDDIVYFHVPPMPEEMRSQFASDLLRAFVAVTGMDVETAMHGFNDFVYESMENRLTGPRLQNRKESFEVALQSNFINSGYVICKESKFLPVNVGSAIDSGLIDNCELAAAMSMYGFFSEALRSPSQYRIAAKEAATTNRTRSDFATSLKNGYESRSTQSADSTISQPVAQENEISAPAEIPAFTDFTTSGQPGTASDSGRSTVLRSVTGFN